MTDDLEPDPRRSRFVRVASAVGDFDSPFYDEERDRDVWNEASAIGFQMLLWGVPLVAAASLWIAGSAALLPIALLLALWAATAVVVLSYAQRFEVDPNERTSLVGGRHAMFLALLALLGTGVVRAGLDLAVVGSSPAASFVRGMGQGMTATAVALCLLLVVLLVRDRLRSRR
ncbi:MAG: hypothetical protein ABR616_16200 [Dermatophilaceae bacterium]